MTLGYGHGIDCPFDAPEEGQGADGPFDAPEEAQGADGPLLDPGQGAFGIYGEAYLPGWEGLCGLLT